MDQANGLRGNIYRVRQSGERLFVASGNGLFEARVDAGEGPSRFERPTRLCNRSPTIATYRPASRRLCSRIVKTSSSAWVRCSCMPSPALMIVDRHRRASKCGAPDEA